MTEVKRNGCYYILTKITAAQNEVAPGRVRGL